MRAETAFGTLIASVRLPESFSLRGARPCTFGTHLRVLQSFLRFRSPLIPKASQELHRRNYALWPLKVQQ